MSGAKFKPGGEKGQQAANEQTVDQTNQKLPAEIGDDVTVDLGKGGRDFVFERRIAQRQIFAPAALDRGAFLEEKEQIDRHHHEAEEKPGHTKETADTRLHQRPQFRDQIRQLFFERGQLLLHPFLDALAIGGGELWPARGR